MKNRLKSGKNPTKHYPPWQVFLGSSRNREKMNKSANKTNKVYIQHRSGYEAATTCLSAFCLANIQRKD